MTPLVMVTLAWVSGILLAQAFSVPPVWLLLPLPCAVTLLLGWGDQRWARRGAAMLIALSLGAGRVLLAPPASAQAASAQAASAQVAHVVTYVDSGEIELEGVVVADPDRRAWDTRLQIDAVEIATVGQDLRDVEGQILLIVPAYTDVEYGDRIRVSGSLTLPPVFDTFSYRDYLARQGIYALLRSDRVDVVASHQANPVLDRLLQFRARAYSVAQTLLPEPQGSLLAGILLGIEQGIPKDLVEAFQLTGTSHIVAISGFNLSLIAALVSRLSRYIAKRRRQLPVTWLVIWTYVFLVGASPAVLRAGVMASLTVLALQEQRKVHGPTSLAAAVLLLSLANPFILWDLGFQLSLAAMMALILYVPLLTSWLEGPLEWLIDRVPAESIITLLAEILIVTVAVQIMTLGITINTFGKISLVAVLTNLLVLPAQSFVMLFGGLALALGLTFRPLGVVCAWLAWVFLAYTTLVVEWTASFPWAAVELGTGGALFIWAYYLLLGLITWWATRPALVRERAAAFIAGLNRTVLAAGAAVVVLIGAAIVARPDGRLHVVFLDVGNGDAVFIRTPTGRQALIDGGSDARRTLAALGKQMPFWDRTLDLVVLTSPDKDRLNGLVPVLSRYDVATVATSSEPGQGEMYEAWSEALEARPIGSWAPVAGSALLDLDPDVTLHVLWPPADVVGPLVLHLTYDEVRFLLLGDATTVVEEALVGVYGAELQSEVLQLARQGAQTSTSAALLQAVAPQAVVVGLDEGRTLSSYVLARIMDIPFYQTGRDGTVDVSSNGTTVDIRTSH